MTTAAKIIISAVLLCTLLPQLSGCGGRASDQAELMKYARKGRPDEGDTESDAPTGTTEQVNPVATSQPKRANVAATGRDPSAVDDAASDAVVNSSENSIPGAPLRQLGDQLSDTKSPPETPLTEEQRRQMAIDNLTAIGQAIELYHTAKTGYPAAYIADAGRVPVLSWRVQLLPYLGYDKLYAKFKLNERWDSPHNKQLLDNIPSVYQSPERFDSNTNFLVPVGTATAFKNSYRGQTTRRWEDGAANTIMVAEADEEFSVPWTSPDELNYDPSKPEQGLFGLRGDGFFSVWGGGAVYLVRKATRGTTLAAAFTVDGGEAVSMNAIRAPAVAKSGGTGRESPSRASDMATNPAGAAPLEGSPRAPLASAGDLGMAFLDAQTAFAAGRETEAVRLYYSGVIGSSEADAWLNQFQWVPGLGRPAPIIRFGMGIVVGGKRAHVARNLALGALAGNGEVSAAYQKLTGAFGQRVLNAVREQPIHSPFFVDTPLPNQAQRTRSDRDVQVATPAKGALLAPVVQFIGVDSQRVLVRAARKHEVDALILFNMEEKAVGSGWVKEVRLSVIDVIRERSIFESAELNSRRVAASRVDLLEDDPTHAVLGEFQEFLANKMVPVEMPSKLKPVHAEQRVNSLSEATDANPLRAMAEIQFYRCAGLIDRQQLLAAYGKILDPESALTLFGGSTNEKLELLTSYLSKS